MSDFSVFLNKLLGTTLGTKITTTANAVADPIIAAAETTAEQTPEGSIIVAGIDALGGKTAGSPSVGVPTITTLASLDPNLGTQIETAVNNALAAVGVPSSDFAAFDAQVMTELGKLGVAVPITSLVG